MQELEEKLISSLTAQGAVEHETLIASLDARERFMLLATVRDMEKRGLLKRDLSEKRDGRAVLRYVRVEAGVNTPSATGTVTNATRT